MDPKHVELHFQLGATYEKLGDYEGIVREMKATIALDPKHADALNFLGYTYAERGENLDEAIALIQRALAIKPNNGYYLDSLGWAYYQKGMLDEAVRELRRAVEAVGDDPIIREHLGDAYFKKGMMAEARREWLKALELDPDNKALREKFKAAGFDKEPLGAGGGDDPPDTPVQTYVVQEGDTLESIAGQPQIYGDPSQWKRIYDANRAQIRDPKILYPGQILKIPR